MEPLALRGSPDSLSRVAEFVASAAAQAGLGRQAAYRLHLAADEIAARIITDGYAASEHAGPLDLTARIDADKLTICLEDTAQPYDPTQHPPPPDLDRPLDERAPGGLGIHLALKSVDCFRSQRVGNRNRSVFGMSRDGTPAEPTSPPARR